MRNRTKLTKFAVTVGLSTIALLLPAVFTPASGGSQNDAQGSATTTKQPAAKKSKTVYVCACMKTKSCSCMTEAKTPGPCSCGTQGSPPMKAVASDSDWAKQNREALAE
jgi:hypothetical protein